ncbi:MAG: rhomboid family intramembrane serine protease [Planctomycetaceae bacterium]
MTTGSGLPDRPLTITADMLAPPPESRLDFERGMRYTAPVTLALVIACSVAFCWQVTSGGLESLEALVDSGALVRDSLLDGEAWRLLSSMFLHGGIEHLVGNMLALYVLGIGCEHAFGSATMAGLYVAAGVAGGLATAAVEPAPTVGASGAIFGLMGCLIAVLQRLRRTVHVRDRRIGGVIAVWAVWQLALGFASPFVANFAHVGGFVAGAVLGFCVPPRAAFRASPEAARA